MKWLSVLYDDHCGICSRLRRWLESQSTFVPLRLVPLHSPDLTKRFPGIESFDPGEKLVVVADDGLVWRGDSAWIMLLWALRDGRELALKLSSPALRPMARRIVTLVSNHRLRFSRWLRLQPDLAADAVTCSDGSCGIVRK
ncbi:MAG: DUF393 domain-containing protein [Verrucomicrobia bacterium]|nr:DUF393 domain-containing protein [Verrucomicrobiota bacterium]